MSSATLSLTIDSVIATDTGTVQEKFYSESFIDANTEPIVLGSITKPQYIIVIGEVPGIVFRVGSTGVDNIGAYPFGVCSYLGYGTVPTVDSIDVEALGPGGDCIIIAGGDE